MTVTEKRKHERFIVEGMDIHAKTILNAEAEILDVSASGISVRCTKRLNIGSVYRFKFEDEKISVSVKGVVIWGKLTGNKEVAREEFSPIYTSGVEFRDVSAEEARQFMLFMTKKLEDLKRQRLSGVRVKVIDPEKTAIAQIETCQVKDISLGGMRVAMGHGVPAEARFRFELILREREPAIPCIGRVAFCSGGPEKAAERYSVGIEFIEMSTDGRARLKKFVAYLSPPLDIKGA